MNQPQAQSLLVLVLGAGIWLFLLGYAHTLTSMLGLTAAVAAGVALLGRVLPDTANDN